MATRPAAVPLDHEPPPPAAGVNGAARRAIVRPAIPGRDEPGDLPERAYADYAPPVAESELNDVLRDELIERLRLHFQDDPFLYICGDLGIYYQRNNRRKMVAPDVFAIRGVPAKPPRRVYRTWIEGKFPDVVIELVSESTVRRDLGAKRRLYAGLGTQEYFLFDLQEGIMLPTLQGFRLEGEEYQPIPETPEGGLRSEVLGLELRERRRPTEGVVGLYLWDPAAQRWLPTPVEAATARAEAATARADAATARAEAAEAEVARLQAMLDRDAGDAR